MEVITLKSSSSNLSQVISSSNYLSQVISDATTAITLNSASALERETAFCFLVIQVIKEDPKKTSRHNEPERTTIRRT